MRRRGTVWVLILLLLAGLTAVSCSKRSRGSQQTAWQRIQQAAQNQDGLETIKACEAYFSGLPTADPNPAETAQAREWYQQAMVRWFLSLPGEPDEEALKHFRQYRALMIESRTGGERP
jgi:hypothetical protein